MSVFERIVENQSGIVELKLFRFGVWVYIEDGRDCCSVGLTPAEIDRLIEKLATLKQEYLVNPPPNPLATAL